MPLGIERAKVTAIGCMPENEKQKAMAGVCVGGELCIPLNAEQKRTHALWVMGGGEKMSVRAVFKECLHKWASRQRLLGNKGLESNTEASRASGQQTRCCCPVFSMGPSPRSPTQPPPKSILNIHEGLEHHFQVTQFPKGRPFLLPLLPPSVSTPSPVGPIP